MSDPFDWKPHMESYIRQLYFRTYPSTRALLTSFNRTFLESTKISRRQRSQLNSHVCNFNIAVHNNNLPRFLKGNRDMERLFDELVADYKKKTRTSPVRRKESTTTSSPSNVPSRTLPPRVKFPPRSPSPARSTILCTIAQEKDSVASTEVETLAEHLTGKEKELMEKENELREMEDIYSKKELRHFMKICELEKQMDEKGEEALDLKKRNEDLANNLAEKEERLQQMEKEMEKMKESASQVQCQQCEAIRQMAENKIRSLGEAVKEKDEMLKSCLRMHETLLQSVVNRPAPSYSQP